MHGVLVLTIIPFLLCSTCDNWAEVKAQDKLRKNFQP
jgi:hypothetical protein